MSFDYSKLLGKIKEVCKTQEKFAKEMGISRTTLSIKLNNKQDFDASEINRACNILGIRNTDIPFYFFCTIGSEN